MNKKQIRGTSGMRERFGLFDAVVHLVLILISVSILYPLLHTIAVSFSDTYNVMANKVLVLPRGFNLESYLYLLRNQKVPRAFLNTVYYTALGVSINLVMTLVMAYPLSTSCLLYTSPMKAAPRTSPQWTKRAACRRFPWAKRRSSSPPRASVPSRRPCASWSASSP